MVGGQGLNSPSELRQWSKSHDISAIIALGRSAMEQSLVASVGVPLIAGALNLKPADKVAGVNLTPDPRLLLARLHELAPRISRVLLVTRGQEDEPFLRIAQSRGRSMGIEIIDYPATNLREATQHFWSIFRYSNANTDAIWLLDSTLVDSENTLPQILENAWVQNFVVVSNVVEHVRRGALLATFVDAEALGTRLARIAIKGGATNAVLGEDVQFAVNARVALHLQLPINERTKADYGLVVAER
jgi:ABC-type uncharacterized transport system substrate-binding protein